MQMSEKAVIWIEITFQTDSLFSNESAETWLELCEAWTEDFYEAHPNDLTISKRTIRITRIFYQQISANFINNPNRT